MIENLIDQLLLLLPPPVFVDFPLLGILLANPNGRYVVAGLAIVTGFIFLWIVLRALQILLGKQAKLGMKTCDKAGVASSPKAKTEDGFQFFKRNGAENTESDDGKALAAIEQEMLAIRQLFVDGHILKDVYVAETRRLYCKAKTLKI